MFEKGILEGFKTVGSFILYKDALAFIIGPDNSGEKLGVMRLGGHIEDGESLLQALKREIMEEGSIEVKMLNSPCTFLNRLIEDKNDLVHRYISGDFIK